MPRNLTVTDTEFDAILAGLRLLQHQLTFYYPAHLDQDIRIIATNCNSHPLPTPECIDDLCERLNG